MHRRSKCAIEKSRVAAQSVVVVLVLGVVLVLVTVLAADQGPLEKTDDWTDPGDVQ